MPWDASSSTGLIARRGILFDCERGEREMLSSVHQVVASTAISLLPPDLIDPMLWAQMINELRCALVSHKVVQHKCV